jgi:hypothetical protein
VKRTKAFLATVMIMALSLLGLYGCGGETPPTPTPVPPTATAVPPTATTELSTPSGGGGSGGTTSGTDATDEDQALIDASLDQAGELKSYHFTFEVKESAFITQPIDVEGDYVAPNKVYMKGKVGDEQVEQIVIGTTVFVKDSSGKWTKQAPDSEQSPGMAFDPKSFVETGNPLASIQDSFSDIKDFKYAGEETVNGNKARRYNFRLATEEMFKELEGSGIDPKQFENLGGGSLWIEESSKNLDKLSMNLDMGPILGLMVQAFAGMMGTPTPGGPQPTPFPSLPIDFEMTISKHNDSSISIPVTPEMEKEAQSGTDVPAEDTPEVTEEPTAESTTEETPEAAPTTESSTGTEITAKVGEEVEVGNTKFTLQNVTRTGEGLMAPKTGNEYLIVDVAIENTGTEDLTTSSLLMFALKDAAGAKMDMAFGANNDRFLDSVQQGPLEPGAKVEGQIAYEVPKGAKGLVLEFAPDPFFNENDKVAVAID